LSVNPGVLAITANGRIFTDVAIAGRSGSTVVAVEHSESRMAMTEGAWLEVIAKALEAWRVEAARKLVP
jgi:hypothetical protein